MDHNFQIPKYCFRFLKQVSHQLKKIPVNNVCSVIDCKSYRFFIKSMRCVDLYVGNESLFTKS